MTVDILFSGSSGNCTLIRSGGTAILVDCGKSCRAVCRGLKDAGCDIGSVDAIFITHEHTDHTQALDTVCLHNDIPVHVTKPSSHKLEKLPNAAERLVVHDCAYSVTIKDLTVESFPLPHDSAAHVGYVVTSSDGDVFGIATDMGHITDEAIENLSRCRRVMVEANHDIEMLAEGPYPPFLKQRIRSPRGHLSNTDCAELVCLLAERGCEAFALAHLSPENNDPTIAYSEIRCALDASGHSDAELVVADRYCAVRLPDGSYRNNTAVI
ncbi:MAG: MBL fold metallo-hydrolase [Clostridia bacterium]|nr:MBL fold metallo-hydrolase [Clostridia bacterium]